MAPVSQSIVEMSNVNEMLDKRSPKSINSYHMIYPAIYSLPRPSDNAFVYSAIEGIANMFQVCGSLSFSIIKLYPEDFYHQVVLVAHEIGHLLGIYHDGRLTQWATMLTHPLKFH